MAHASSNETWTMKLHETTQKKHKNKHKNKEKQTESAILLATFLSPAIPWAAHARPEALKAARHLDPLL